MVGQAIASLPTTDIDSINTDVNDPGVENDSGSNDGNTETNNNDQSANNDGETITNVEDLFN